VHEFAPQLQVAKTLDEQLQVKSRQRGYSQAQAVLALVYNVVSGGTCWSDLEVLRGDAGTQQLLEVESLLGPTTAGQFLPKFDLGDIADLSRLNRLLQERVRQEPAVPASRSGTMDLDASVYEQASDKKQGSTTAYHGEIG
jgi:hypothetical protein